MVAPANHLHGPAEHAEGAGASRMQQAACMIGCTHMLDADGLKSGSSAGIPFSLAMFASIHFQGFFKDAASSGLAKTPKLVNSARLQSVHRTAALQTLMQHAQHHRQKM